MAKVLLDTNFLLIPSQFKVDIYSELERILAKPELFTLDKNIDELTNLSKSKLLKERRAAKIALSLLKQKGVCVIKTKSFLNRIKNPKDIDSFIVECSKEGYIVATQDSELKTIIPREIPLIVLRKKQFLALLER